MNDHDYESLLWMNESDIDFSALPEGILEKLAMETEYYIATSALIELARRSVPHAGVVAKSILDTGHGDNHLQAVALSSLFYADPDAAMPFLLEFAETMDPVRVREALNIASANTEKFSSGSCILIDVLKRRLEQFSREQLGDDVVDTFREAYPPRGA